MATTGIPLGVRKTLFGHPPPPVSSCVASMYWASTAGSVSRSTFTGTNPALSTEATAGSSKLSSSITWHQWQVA